MMMWLVLCLQWFVNKFPVWPPHPPLLPKPNMNKKYYNHHQNHHHHHYHILSSSSSSSQIWGQLFNASLKMTSEGIQHGKLLLKTRGGECGNGYFMQRLLTKLK